MADNSRTAGPPRWRPVVRAAAHEAASADSQLHWGQNAVSFNYRWEHVQATVRLAIRLAELTGADVVVVEAAAWLHDIAKPHSQDHGSEGALVARQILADTDFPPHKIGAVAQAIVRHVGLFTDETVEPLEAAVLWDADKLSKLGATAILHFTGYMMMTGVGTVAGWLDKLPGQPWMERTVRSLHTTPAREAGQRRFDIYRRLWAQALLEFDGADLLEDGVMQEHA